jgi:hypothetical protein
MGELHDRMPVILDDADWPKWLGEEAATEAELLALLKPCPDEALIIWPVDKAVGNVRNKGGATHPRRFDKGPRLRRERLLIGYTRRGRRQRQRAYWVTPGEEGPETEAATDGELCLN